MTTAALVAGNTVVLKPSSDAAGIATMFLEACEEAGVPGRRPEFPDGRRLDRRQRPRRAPEDARSSRSPARATSASRSTRRPAASSPGQLWIKRAILEMGGKDFILVDETADLEDAANGIVAAAFGFQGQKCSACSRADRAPRGARRPARTGRREDQGPDGRRRARPARTPSAPSSTPRAQKKILEYVGDRQEGRAKSSPAAEARPEERVTSSCRRSSTA